MINEGITWCCCGGGTFLHIFFTMYVLEIKHASRAGSSHNLDLNLGISPLSKDAKEIDYQFHGHGDQCNLHSERSLRVIGILDLIGIKHPASLNLEKCRITGILCSDLFDGNIPSSCYSCPLSILLQMDSPAKATWLNPPLRRLLPTSECPYSPTGVYPNFFSIEVNNSM